MTTTDLRKELGAVLALAENCTPGRFVAAADGLITGDTDDALYEVGVTPGWNKHDRELIVATINFLRTHGQALVDALAASAESAEPFAYYDCFNDEITRSKEQAGRSEAGGNLIRPLYFRPDDRAATQEGLR